MAGISEWPWHSGFHFWPSDCLSWEELRPCNAFPGTYISALGRLGGMSNMTVRERQQDLCVINKLLPPEKSSKTTWLKGLVTQSQSCKICIQVRISVPPLRTRMRLHPKSESDGVPRAIPEWVGQGQPSSKPHSTGCSNQPACVCMCTYGWRQQYERGAPESQESSRDGVSTSSSTLHSMAEAQLKVLPKSQGNWLINKYFNRAICF